MNVLFHNVFVGSSAAFFGGLFFFFGTWLKLEVVYIKFYSRIFLCPTASTKLFLSCNYKWGQQGCCLLFTKSFDSVPIVSLKKSWEGTDWVDRDTILIWRKKAFTVRVVKPTGVGYSDKGVLKSQTVDKLKTDWTMPWTTHFSFEVNPALSKRLDYTISGDPF